MTPAPVDRFRAAIDRLQAGAAVVTLRSHGIEHAMTASSVAWSMCVVGCGRFDERANMVGCAP